MREQRVSDEVLLARVFFGDVHRRDERAALLREQGLRRLRVAELATTVRVAAGFDHAACLVDCVEAVLGVGGQRSAELRELGDDVLAALVRRVLEHRVLVVAIELDVAVVRVRQAGHEHLEARAVGGHPRARQELAPVQAVDRREQVGGALDEAHERAHRDVDLALREVTSDAIERHELRELLMDEPREPLARHLRARVRRGQRRRRGALQALPTAARRAAHDASALVLLDGVQLLFDDLVGDVQVLRATVLAVRRS